MTTNDTKSSAAKVLGVLDVLLRNFAHGFSPTELSRETGLAPSDITRYVAVLEQAGFAERIQETNRIRPSHRHARFAIQIMRSLDAADQQLAETKSRLYGSLETDAKRAMTRIIGK